MGLFDAFRKKKTTSPEAGPYRNPAFNKLYQLLFCDNLELFNFANAINTPPWNILLSEQMDISAVLAIARDPQIETRTRILAYNKLRSANAPITERDLLAVIIEVGLESGLDTLAAYQDGTARLIHHKESLLVWDTRTPLSNQLINQLLQDSTNVVRQIGPWTKPRKAPPTFGMLRLSFICSDGLYFGEGPFNELEKDKKAAPVILAATRLMSFLIQQRSAKPST